MRSDRDTLDRASHSLSRNNNDTWTGNQSSSFDNDPFDFTAIQSTARTPTEANPPFVVSQPRVASQATPIVKVYLHEQLAARYDDVSSEGVVNIEGTIYVQATGRSSTPFCLVIRDLLDQIEHIEEHADVCYNMTNRVSLKGLHQSDRVLRITLNQGSTFRETIVLKYFCVPTLRPVPLVRLPFKLTSAFQLGVCSHLLRSFIPSWSKAVYGSRENIREWASKLEPILPISRLSFIV